MHCGNKYEQSHLSEIVQLMVHSVVKENSDWRKCKAREK